MGAAWEIEINMRNDRWRPCYVPVRLLKLGSRSINQSRGLCVVNTIVVRADADYLGYKASQQSLLLEAKVANSLR